MTVDPSREPALRRGVSLRGAAAIGWLEARGSSVTDRADVSLVTDELTGDGFRLARLWHTAAAVEMTGSAGSTRVVVPVEGRTFVVAEGGRVRSELAPGAVLVLAEGAVEVTTPDPSIARFEIALESGMIPGPLRELIGAHAVLAEVPVSFRVALVSAANAVLNTELDLRSQGLPALRLAFSHLAVAIVSAGLEGAGRERFSRRELALQRRAMEVIAERARDPEFTIERLAQELSISERYVHRVFSAAGSSPALEIRAARAAVARSYSEGAVGRGLTAEERARLAGFANATAMRRALRRTD
jgi:AraC-like DNA-binding protein